MKDFVELLKLPPSILAALTMSTGFILFLPITLLRKLGLDQLPEYWRMILGLLFIMSLSLLGIYIILKLGKWLVLRYYKIRFKLRFPKMMKSLRHEELIVVALLYQSPNYTSRLPNNDGVTIRLKSKYVIQLTSSTNVTFGPDLVIPFTITPVAQTYIDKHPALIKNIS